MALFWMVLLLALSTAGQGPMPLAATEPDMDEDGISDSMEQALLERFLPRFHISQADCDGMPATFAPNESVPRVLSRNGAIYGQATPIGVGGGPARVELHYYHLWGQDCGRFSHPLDVEHVAALVERQPARTSQSSAHPSEGGPFRATALWEWKALYWFAAGHQNTVCDVSHAARGELLVAEWIGPDIWISKNKHASYLTHERCRLGCGGDTCPQMVPLSTPGIINLGEPGKPMNGAIWATSPSWPLAKKMSPQFGLSTISQIERASPGKVVAVNRALPPVRATILAGGETLDGVAVGGKHTGAALKTGKASTGSALGKAFRAVGRALGVSEDQSSETATVTKPDDDGIIPDQDMVPEQ